MSHLFLNLVFMLLPLLCQSSSGNSFRHLATTPCAQDSDCKGIAPDQFCSSGECRAGGTCSSLLDCKNPANMYATIQCVGFLKCEQELCGVECSGGFCPKGDDVNCETPPCSVATCDEPYVSCVDDNCGSCNAIFYNAKGEQVCKTPEKKGTQCSSDADCTEQGQFCGAGVCHDAGTCSQLLDCQNPSNLYPDIMCVGYKYCGDGGLCGRECTGSFCPNGDDVTCETPPCSTTTCDEPYVSCVDNTCGSCSAIFINAKGEQVCKTPEANKESKCSSDADCNEQGQYCGAGVCRDGGTCGELLDCQNPSNLYPDLACVGYKYCSTEGSCGRQCGGSFCPNGDDVTCEAPPCSVETCDEPYVSCVDDNCGSCSAIFINAKGEQVCKTPEEKKETKCSSDADCTQGHFCGAGVCHDAGTCSKLLDCQNPANLYAEIMCVGYKYCSAEGSCGRQCSGSFCPNGDDVTCETPPCSTTTCDEPYVSCVDDNCGSCSAIFINAKGEQVCKTTEKKEAKCSSDADCTEQGQYCGAGVCRDGGTCGELLDCLNPLNFYKDIKCVGYKYCQEGVCGRECTGSFCPNNDEVQCAVEPCSVAMCDEPYESCVNDYCGGCNAILFDSAGRQVCSAGPTAFDGKDAKECEMDADCVSDENDVCREGKCEPAEAGSNSGAFSAMNGLKVAALMAALVIG